MSYAALSTIQTIATGQPFTAATLQQANDNDAFFATPPACSVYNSTAQSHTSTGNFVVLTADSENFDTDSMHSTSSSTSRITIQTAGRYQLVAGVTFAANTTGHRAIQFYVDGTTQLAPSSTVQAIQTGSTATGVVVSRPYVFTAAQYVEVRAYQNSGGNLNVTLDEFTAFLLTLS